jgi:hypothetical protein
MTTELWRGWAFSSLGELGYALELLLAATTVLMGCIGALRCLIGPNGGFETAFIEREHGVVSEDHPIGKTAASGRNGQVTIRLEPGYSRFFRRHRFIVTIREAPEDVRERERATWYTDDGG